MSNIKLAAPELAAIEVHGMTRHAFMARSAIAAGTVYGLSTVGPFVRQAMAQEGGGDVDILNFALTLEYLEAAFYAQALKQVSGLGGEAKKIATTLRDNEDQHVAALTSTIKDLGGKPVKAPGVDFGKAFAEREVVPEDRPDVRGPRGERLQRRGARHRVQGGPGGRRRHRAGGGPPRGGHPPPAR